MFRQSHALMRNVQTQVAERIGSSLVGGHIKVGDALPSEMKICNMVRIDQTWLGFSGGLASTSLPLFHGLRPEGFSAVDTCLSFMVSLLASETNQHALAGTERLTSWSVSAKIFLGKIATRRE